MWDIECGSNACSKKPFITGLVLVWLFATSAFTCMMCFIINNLCQLNLTKFQLWVCISATVIIFELCFRFACFNVVCQRIVNVACISIAIVAVLAIATGRLYISKFEPMAWFGICWISILTLRILSIAATITDNTLLQYKSSLLETSK